MVPGAGEVQEGGGRPLCPRRCSSWATTTTKWKTIVSYIDATGRIEGAPGINWSTSGVRLLVQAGQGHAVHSLYAHQHSWAAHVACFLSGAISKTVNLPHEASADDVAEAYAELAAGNQGGGHLIATAPRARSR